MPIKKYEQRKPDEMAEDWYYNITSIKKRPNWLSTKTSEFRRHDYVQKLFFSGCRPN